MLTLWRRHRLKCPHKGDRYYRKCRCAIWGEGTVESKYIRRSLKTRSWERATEIARDIERGKIEQQSVTIEHVLRAFIEDCEARNLKPNTLAKYRRLSQRLVAFATSERRTAIAEIDTGLCGSFRGSWKLSPRTA